MKQRMAMLVLAALVICMLGTPGCRRRSKSGGPGSGDNIGGLLPGGGEAGDASLAYRPEGGLELLPDVQFDKINFDYDSAQVKESERSKVESVADYLKRNAGSGVIIEGHCDERGSAEYNMALGERRALAVRAYLIGLGADGEAIQTKSYGEERPESMGHDEAAWALNRRAAFVFFKR